MELKNLSKEELLKIDGGKPNEKTSFAYDLFWGVSWFCKEVWETLTSDNQDSSYINTKVGSY